MSMPRKLTNAEVHDLICKICGRCNQQVDPNTNRLSYDDVYYPMNYGFTRWMVRYYVGVQLANSRIPHTVSPEQRRHALENDPNLVKIAQEGIKRCTKAFKNAYAVYKYKFEKVNDERLVWEQRGEDPGELNDPGLYLFLPFFYNLEQVERYVNKNGDVIPTEQLQEGLNHFSLGIVDVVSSVSYYLDSLHVEREHGFWADVIKTFINSVAYRETFGQMVEPRSTDDADDSEWDFLTFGRVHQELPLCSYYILLYLILYTETVEINDIAVHEQCCDAYVCNIFAEKMQKMLMPPPTEKKKAPKKKAPKRKRKVKRS